MDQGGVRGPAARTPARPLCPPERAGPRRRDKNELLNGTTAVIEYWQDEPRHSIDAARGQFPDYYFQGY